MTVAAKKTPWKLCAQVGKNGGRFGDELRSFFRHPPLTDVHAHAELAARAAEAAAAQDHFWDLHDLLFAHQDELEFEDLVGYAADLGLDVAQFTRDLDDERYAERVRQDVASAEASGARGTRRASSATSDTPAPTTPAHSDASSPRRAQPAAIAPNLR